MIIEKISSINKIAMLINLFITYVYFSN